MSKKIFINLPVADLQNSMAFYTAIGFTNNPQFTDETAGCMVLSEEIYVMLLTHEKFGQFIKKEIGNAAATTSVINAVSLDSAQEVNDTMEKVLAAGGKESVEAKDYGFMQQRSFEDLDGHQWEVFFMDMSKFPQQ
ncbi:MAG TPA: glyoxalase/bleomycin resistance/extradiol dioxygenase family protein [Niabella sp.]|nr:glyoxalase/bleomycin resistance/extradiol dioxygenase family protein [Niabella sp.]HOZ95885.1 glyoxalase/bleomycin resistance/extradiol dioxygenase family protein [Niabella sp.]HQW15797.1 glyoxalase/bleomycin resistance/extradiol dioxygenase family protein [Niabella sp.]HQX20937.1 glyoxalase/bleomycin resistance/extradiol dioxygenase family protein [Niabella sp.]HQX41419.1 glyoxalase/bleomycin resistance/extradiol dioxygenase family protein [Niabella sp.]